MSDKHNHGDHNHDHGHDHKHDQPKDLKTIMRAPAPTPTQTPPPGGESILEDTGSRALSEALRSSFVIVKVVMVLLVIVFLGSGVFTVPNQEKAIVLRFGKPVGEGDAQLLGPGLHWSFPYPIDEVVRIPIGELQSVRSTVGWFARTPGLEEKDEPDPGPSLNPAADGYTLTSDANIIHVSADLRYRIIRPLDYVLNFTSGANVVQNTLDNALFQASSQFTVDQVLTSDKLGFQEKVLAKVKQTTEEIGLGISIENLDLRVREPRQVAQAFRMVTEAAVGSRKALDDARGYANTILSTAEGEATSIINAGETDRTRLVQAVAAEAGYFQDQLPHYKSNPELFTTRLKAEAIGRIMTNSHDKLFIPGNQELRLQLNREPPKPKTQQQQQGPGPQGSSSASAAPRAPMPSSGGGSHGAGDNH
ncbi:MAG: protease modulator HflK [Verrucomicrobiales bacterium]